MSRHVAPGRLEWLRVSILSFLLFTSVLTSAADADCAWILWDIWKSGAKAPLGSFENQSQCEESAGRYEARALRDNKDKDVQYVCFPDTVDPRAPKKQ